MAPPNEVTVPSMRRVRKSVGANAEMKRTVDKENATVDVARTLADDRKKSRSKSMGPGGLDALKHATGNRRASIAAPAKPRSILKPTIYSVQDIPPLKNESRRTRNPNESRDSTKSLISSNDDSTSGSKVALKTEEEQQAAARERDERERRDARRKSLANRRVSFAAEATLHTFHEIEYMQDSTTSTDSSRRASSFRGAESSGAVKSPDDQRSNRRNSELPPLNFHNTDDDTLTSTIYSSDSEPPDAVEEIEEDSGSSGDSDDGTMMTIETEEVTGTTVASERYGSDDESSTLDRALRMAAQRAGTQRLDDDDNDKLDDDEEVIPSFGWVKKSNASTSAQGASDLMSQQEEGIEMDVDMDMDMTGAVGRIIKSQEPEEFDSHEGLTMDITQALGGILSEGKGEPVAQDDASTEAAMEFTTAVGRIYQPQTVYQDESDTNEDFSMEFTAAMGGVLPSANPSSANTGRRHTLNRQGEAGMEDATMDMTVGYGNILPCNMHEGDHTVQGDETMGMDITTALGGIIANGDATSRSLEKRATEGKDDKPNSPKRGIMAVISQKTPTRRSSRLSGMSQNASPSTKLESPGLTAFGGKELHRSTGPQTPDTISSPLRTPTPSPPKPSPPRAQAAAARAMARGPKSKSLGSTTPRGRGVAQLDQCQSPTKSLTPRHSLFRNDGKTGGRTPTIVLTPQTRRLSGVGADKSGLGSPKVTALLERRSSISDSATDFIPGKREGAFEDPKTMEEEIDRERKVEEEKENRRKILEREVDGPQEDREATLNLREMIDSLSPKRNALKGRKSLHVGSAKGLLGKRPLELDDDEDSEEDDGVKRLKGHNASPVKNIKLQQPPSVAETTGRLTRAPRKSLEPQGGNTTCSLSSPLKKDSATMPRRPGLFQNLRESQTVHEVNFDQSHGIDTEILKPDVDNERIHLQDFLNMTSIRFMELTTTKRRHTVAPKRRQDGSSGDGEDDMSLERCVVAGACTVPMLELYQHSCRELKNYIAEGRRMVKEIEEETFEVNPPLFHEYMCATSDVKALMDNQFKNVKTHARLLSKAMWYEWRMKLQEGLKEGLMTIAQGMDADEKMIKEREDLLSAVLPGVLERYERLEEESGNLDEAAKELADCDPAELQAARDELTDLDADIDAKKRLIEEFREQLESSTSEVEDVAAKKQNLVTRIQQSEKVREACRGWTGSEVENLKSRVDALEKEYGWGVTGLSGTNLSMTYRREIEVVFDVASFQPHRKNSRIDLWYIGDNMNGRLQSKTAEKEFFLQCIRDHVRALPQSRTKILDLLNIVRNAWDKARFLALQLHTVNITFPTYVTKTSDSSVAVTSSLLLTPLRTRIETTLHLHGHSATKGVDVEISAQVKVVYGEHFNVNKVGEFLSSKIGDKLGDKGDDWSDVLVELQQRLIARGKKQMSSVTQ
ncbi:chromosome segregation protein [Metarhizium album ARSEF 1941]|uniref:Chromosome segregation protein n=1 Tax=Metarhizium album (strain ARSEF 1941) TaxID=1081103 RepID=A0A0B2WKY9_METAS|nr:chromosome segregation protein [Metarhizium album ARSEF 1941]KHN96716.1 chromosome segregation protein [Metarhizium album ARSEF 1941]